MELVKLGKRIIISIILSVLLIDIIVNIYAASLHVQDIIRFILTSLLLFFLYKGHKWAKWLTILLILTAGISLIIFNLSSFKLYILALAIVYIGIGLILLFSKSVKAFFRSQRGEDIKNEITNDNVVNK